MTLYDVFEIIHTLARGSIPRFGILFLPLSLPTFVAFFLTK